MFDDSDLQVVPDLKRRMDLYQEWEAEVEAALTSHSGSLVILELGCGLRCPSVRRECEDVLEDCLRRAGQLVEDPSHSATATLPAGEDVVSGSGSSGFSPAECISTIPRALLIRVNIDEASHSASRHPQFTLPIQEKAMATLRAIDDEMRRL
eukprot:9420962-Pyramimonas_sp.AAC.2